MYKYFLSLLFFLTFSFNACASQPSAKVGEEAPDFTLTGMAGSTHSLSEHRGKFVILEWINHDCPFVKKHYGSQNMQSLQRFATENDVVWLSIASSAPGKQGHYTDKEWQKLTSDKSARPTAVLLDPSGIVGRAYDAKTTPHMYLISPEGILLAMGAIDGIPSANPADIPKATNYVRENLKAALAGEKIPHPSTKAYGCSVKY